MKEILDKVFTFKGGVVAVSITAIAALVIDDIIDKTNCNLQLGNGNDTNLSISTKSYTNQTNISITE